MKLHPSLFLFVLLCLNRVALADEVPPPWAYGFKTPAPPEVSLPVPPPASTNLVPKPADLILHHLPGTDRQFNRIQITDIFGPADWYPQDHPPMPEIVAKGKAPAVWACARCHYPNGKGRPENAPIAGLPVEYFIAQLHSFRAGDRQTSDVRKPNTKMMTEYARGLTEEEMRVAAEYFGSMKWTPWIRVIETDRVPQTTLSAGMFLPVANAPDEPIGNRIIEVPEDVEAVELLRNPRTGFIAYAPIGSIKRGEELVTTGGGRTLACAACHGPDLKGMTIPGIGTTPGLAGRSPSYLTRQMFDIKSGARRGPSVELMKPVVANLTSEDMLAISAFLASRIP
ncbi:MAG: Cytochrome c [Chthoniobacteraceae bacterium]|nr:Cytochrome c [Chthoniobacteraceae bacterium]